MTEHRRTERTQHKRTSYVVEPVTCRRDGDEKERDADDHQTILRTTRPAARRISNSPTQKMKTAPIAMVWLMKDWLITRDPPNDALDTAGRE